MQYSEGNRLMNQADKYNRGFDRKKEAKPGSSKNPVTVVVASEERRQEVQALCDEKGWFCSIEVDEARDEDLSSLEMLKKAPETKVVDKKPGRNDPCICGSGKKYKKCCG